MHRWPPTSDVAVVPWTRNERAATAGLKTTSYAENVVALAWAHERRCGRGDVRQHPRRAVRGHRQQRLLRVRTGGWSRRRCRAAAWRASPGSCCWSGWAARPRSGRCRSRAGRGGGGVPDLVDAGRAAGPRVDARCWRRRRGRCRAGRPRSSPAGSRRDRPLTPALPAPSAGESLLGHSNTGESLVGCFGPRVSHCWAGNTGESLVGCFGPPVSHCWDIATPVNHWWGAEPQQ